MRLVEAALVSTSVASLAAVAIGFSASPSLHPNTRHGMVWDNIRVRGSTTKATPLHEISSNGSKLG